MLTGAHEKQCLSSDLHSSAKPCPVTVLGERLYILKATFKLGGSYLAGINFRHSHKSLFKKNDQVPDLKTFNQIQTHTHFYKTCAINFKL